MKIEKQEFEKCSVRIYPRLKNIRPKNYIKGV
jgi:hypothetical protein